MQPVAWSQEEHASDGRNVEEELPAASTAEASPSKRPEIPKLQWDMKVVCVKRFKFLPTSLHSLPPGLQVFSRMAPVTLQVCNLYENALVQFEPMPNQSQV